MSKGHLRIAPRYAIRFSLSVFDNNNKDSGGPDGGVSRTISRNCVSGNSAYRSANTQRRNSCSNGISIKNLVPNRNRRAQFYIDGKRESPR